MGNVWRKCVYTMTVEATAQKVAVDYVFDEASRQLTRALAAVLAVGLNYGVRAEMECSPAIGVEPVGMAQAVALKLTEAPGTVNLAMAQAQAVRRLYNLAAGLIDGQWPVDTYDGVKRAQAELDGISLEILRAFPIDTAHKDGK